MLRFLLTSFIIFYFGTLSAQEIIHEEQIGWRGSDISLSTIPDKTGSTHCMVLVNDDSIRCFQLDQSEKIVGEFHLPRLNREKVLGGFIRDGKIYLFLDYRYPPALHNYVLDPGTGSISQNLVAFDLKKEKVVDRLNAGDHFLYFTINKKTSEFIIYDWHNQEDMDTIRYHFEDQEVWNDLSVSAGFTRDVNVAKVDEAGDCGEDIAGNPNKIYLHGDTLFLLMNKDRGITRVYSFNTLTREVSTRDIIHNKIGENKIAQAGYVDNSFLYEDKLYFVSASSDRLAVQVLDFNNGKILKKFITERDDSISYKNTPIIQEGSVPILYVSFSKTKELEKTRQLLRKMVNGNAVVSAIYDSAGIAITIGSYLKVTQSSGGGGTWMPSGGSAGGAPTMTYVPTGGFSRSTWTKATRFRMSIDKNTLEHLPGEMQKSINDRIEEYTSTIKIPDGAENLFLRNDHYVYIYYDKKLRSLVFTRFNK
jgi:hypothetical protein